jgi:hypothetical protein
MRVTIKKHRQFWTFCLTNRPKWKDNFHMRIRIETEYELKKALSFLKKNTQIKLSNGMKLDEYKYRHEFPVELVIWSDKLAISYMVSEDTKSFSESMNGIIDEFC